MLFHKSPSYEQLRVFGCLAFISTLKHFGLSLTPGPNHVFFWDIQLPRKPIKCTTLLPRRSSIAEIWFSMNISFLFSIFLPLTLFCPTLCFCLLLSLIVLIFSSLLLLLLLLLSCHLNPHTYNQTVVPMPLFLLPYCHHLLQSLRPLSLLLLFLLLLLSPLLFLL